MNVPPPTHLRVEHLDVAFGIDERHPRLSWWLPEGSRRQLAYRIRAGDWVSGTVESDRSVLVPYTGPPLASGQRVDWSVRVWTDAGESDWADAGWWEMGPLDAADWIAQWIEPAEVEPRQPTGQRPGYLLRKEFAVDEAPATARLYATAHGIYELFVNGERVGDAELTPGSTAYRSRLQFQTWDVTDLVAAGRNVVGGVLSDGWYRGQNGPERRADAHGDRLALLVQLHLVGHDAAVVRLGSDATWVSSSGEIVAADLMQGQHVDLLRRRPDWSRPGADVAGWSPVALRGHDHARLCASPAPPVRRIEEVRPRSVTRIDPDRHVVDLGQNINGWVRLTDLGPAGTSITLTHGEALDGNGDVTVSNILVGDGEAHPHAPIQVDRVDSAGREGDVFEPRHTTHGFRYVRIEGHPGRLTSDDVAGIVVHTDLRRTGSFRCNDERINRLHDAAVWSLRGNACDVPTDCPTRERSGWTGDWQIFVEAAAFLYDVAGFSTKWLRDVAADQRSDGAVLHISPAPQSESTPPYLSQFPPGSAGWGDAAVIVPWEIYRAYGDERLLEEQWSSMAGWVDYAARAARSGRHPERARSRPDSAPHEQFIWDTGFHWGEWLEPDMVPDGFDADSDDPWLAELSAADHGSVATAYLHLSSKLLARIAGILGRHDDSARYSDLADATRSAWQAEFLRADGTVDPSTQATCVRALAFDLATEEVRPSLAVQLVGLIREAGMHLATGFLATPYLLPVLAGNGHLDVAYELLLQDTEPSWLTMIERGATTVWEQWNGVGANGDLHDSLNHYSKGAVVSFLHRYVAGIRLLDDGPAYRRFRVEPLPGGGLTAAMATHDSPYGRIESSWTLDGDRFRLDVVVPPGTVAEVRLPDGEHLEVNAGETSVDCRIASPNRELESVSFESES